MTQSDNPDIQEKYNSQRWKKLRKLKKQVNPFCERCFAKGKYVPTYMVHHKEYINEDNYMDDNVFFNMDNLESLCKSCHNAEHFGEKMNYFFDENGDIICNQ